MQHNNTMSVKIVLSKLKQSISNIYWGYIPVDSRSLGTHCVSGLRPPDCLHRSFSPAFSITGFLALWANQVAHGCHIGCVAGELQAAEFPSIFDGVKHGIVVIGHVGSAR